MDDEARKEAKLAWVLGFLPSCYFLANGLGFLFPVQIVGFFSPGVHEELLTPCVERD